MHALVRRLCVCACAYELMRAPAVEKLRDHGRIARGTFNAERTTIQPCVYVRNLICQLSEAFNENCITRAVYLCVVCECMCVCVCGCNLLQNKTARQAAQGDLLAATYVCACCLSQWPASSVLVVRRPSEIDSQLARHMQTGSSITATI